MRKFFLIFVLSLSISMNLFSQDTNIVKYLPLKAGNVWVYYYFYFSLPGNSSGYQRFQITGTTTHNSKTFYMYNTITRPIQGTSICTHPLFGEGKHIRIDSLNGKVMGWEFCNPISQEYMLDSLYAMLNDSARDCRVDYDRKVCSDTAIQSIFGLSKQSKQFSVSGNEYGATWRYIKDIGFSRLDKGNGDYNCHIILRGCVIDGVVYGDTTFMITGINLISNEIPKQFSLSQNYPNPFNPSTKIKFEIPGTPLSLGEGPGVGLHVYNTLGQQIATLVNEQLKPGTYEVEFNAADYPSGVYFYKLVGGDPSLSSGQGFAETKKMVLIK